jgi:O-antigen/teichoic acid export membrane protein
MNRMEIPALSLAYIMGMIFLVGAAFFLVPKIAPFVLVVISTFLLVIVGYLHYKQFGVSEYERNTWTDKLRDQSPYILFGGILLIAAIVYYLSSYVSSGVQSTISLPSFGNQSSLPSTMPQAGGWLKGLFRK